MKTLHFSPTSASSPSFALISVLALVSLAALTATAFLASARLERQATMPLTQTTKLDMALDCGSVAAMRLLDLGSGEQFNHVVTYWRGTNTADWTNELGYLLIGTLEAGNITNKPLQLKYYFCFSSAALTNLGTNLVEYTDRENADDQGQFNRKIGEVLEPTNITTRTGTNFAAGQFTNIPLLGDTTNNRFTSPPVGWVYIKQDVRVKPGQTNTTNVPVTRFAFYVQDLSSMIDAERMGGETDRSTGTNPSEISLTNLTGTALTASTKVVNFTTTNTRMKYLTPGMLVHPGGGGLNTNDLRYVTTGLRHWTNAYERIPFGLGYSNCGTANTGTNKFNLGNTNTNVFNVTTISSWITSNLTTNFLARAGGLTNSILYASSDFDYAKCLAANIVDYIDTNSIPTALDAAQGYRGTEALPYCTEFALRFRLEDAENYNDTITNSTPAIIATTTNRIRPSINAYLELWNPHVTNIPLTTLGISFKSYGTNDTGEDAIAIGCNQFVRKFEDIATSYSEGSSGPLTNLTFDFSKGTNASGISTTTNGSVFLPSNTYCVIKLNHDHSFTNIGPRDAINWTNTTNASGKVTSKFLYRGASTTKRVYVAQNTTNFQSNCYVPGGVAVNSSLNSGRKGLLELSLGGVVYDRARSFRFDSTTPEGNAINGPNPGCKYKSWNPSLTFHDPANGNLLMNTGDPRITYFLRNQSLSGYVPRDIAFANTSFGGPNKSPSLAANSTNSFSTDLSFLSTSIRLDAAQWPDGGHNPANYGFNPLGGNPETDSANEPILATIVATEPNKAPAFIRNGPMTNILELGNIYDPILWRRVENGNITSNSIADPKFGGGNTLRIGRAEHPLFAWTKLSANANDPSIPNMQMSAAALLDLFCLSNQFDEGGKINLNTAPAPVLRALAGGIYLRSDQNLMVGTVTNANYPIPAEMAEAFAQGVMRFRSKYPFYSPSQLSFIGTDTNWPNTSTWPSNAVFGNTNAISLVTNSVNTLTNSSLGITDWNDQAAEEWFAKIFSLSTVYSRNFRVYVIAQKATTNSSGTFIGTGPVVRKYYNLLIRQANPGTNEVPGSIPVITSQSYY